MQNPKILVVDDEKDVRNSLSSILSRKINCEIKKAANGEDALEELRKAKFDLVLLDIKLPGLSGIDVIKEAAKFTPETRILAISAYDSYEIADRALEAGAVDFLHKPITPETIELKIKDILTKIGKYWPK